MLGQSDIVIEENNGTYQIEAKPSGMYLVWYEVEPGKWVGLAVVKTPVDAHEVIKAYEKYLARVFKLETKITPLINMRRLDKT